MPGEKLTDQAEGRLLSIDVEQVNSWDEAWQSQLYQEIITFSNLRRWLALTTTNFQAEISHKEGEEGVVVSPELFHVLVKIDDNAHLIDSLSAVLSQLITAAKVVREADCRATEV